MIFKRIKESFMKMTMYQYIMLSIWVGVLIINYNRQELVCVTECDINFIYNVFIDSVVKRRKYGRVYI